MKRISVMSLVLCWSLHVVAQQPVFAVHTEKIDPEMIEATFDQTTNMLFPYAVLDADWGSNGIIVQQTRAAKNILRVKAARKNFSPTSLTVVTGDGQFYAFVVRYVDTAESLNYIVKKDTAAAVAVVPNNERLLEKDAGNVRNASSFLHVSKRALGSRLQLKSLYLLDHYLWLKTELRNSSQLDFPVNYVRFFLTDIKKVKRKVIQQKEMVPVFADPVLSVAGKTTGEMVYAFEPFAVPNGQHLIMQVSDRSGARFIQLKVAARKILKARKINSEP